MLQVASLNISKRARTTIIIIFIFISFLYKIIDIVHTYYIEHTRLNYHF